MQIVNRSREKYMTTIAAARNRYAARLTTPNYQSREEEIVFVLSTNCHG
jgi:hypothetical protein